MPNASENQSQARNFAECQQHQQSAQLLVVVVHDANKGGQCWMEDMHGFYKYKQSVSKLVSIIKTETSWFLVLKTCFQGIINLICT